MNERVQRLREAGSVDLARHAVQGAARTGEFERLMGELGVSGATSNPTIFAKAITGSDRYDAQLCALAQAGVIDPQELFFSIGLDDARSAADLLRATHEQSAGADGFVSFECTPDLVDEN